MLRTARITLRQHWFEVTAAVLPAVAATMLGLSIAIRVDALAISQDCIDRVRSLVDGSGAGIDCWGPFQAGSAILGETYLNAHGTISMSVMGVLPFLLGLLGGVPIVARELESGTAQTAWWLTGSRSRWLARQISPIAAVLGLAMVAASLVAGTVVEEWVRWGNGGASDLIGSYGLPAFIRACGAFGIGVAVGAILGRTLPAFIVGVALIATLGLAVGQLHDGWLASLPTQVTADESGNPLPGTTPTAWGWIGPNGQLISQEAAREIATAAGVPPAEPGDVQDFPAMSWLAEHGYRGVPLGVTDESALAWAPLDGFIFGAVALFGLGGAFVVVNHRRPS
jgi:hypothetical protein